MKNPKLKLISTCCKDENYVKSLFDEWTGACKKCNKIIKLIVNKNWKEEFEDELIIMGDSGNVWVTLQKRDLDSLLRKYNLLNEEVKIKVRDGVILIERIK